MELFCNGSNRMTEWLVSSGFLTNPFVLIDVGVQDGISPRWNALQDHLVVYGFDLLEEAIADLKRNADSRHYYFPIGLADRDGEVDITVPANRYETQLYSGGPGERRRVQIRRLDTLLRDGVIGEADFIKLDCEGYEPLVFRGATDYFSRSNLVGADTESNFNLSNTVPNMHFAECCEAFVPQRLTVFDIAFNRVAVGSWPGLAEQGVRRPAVLNLLFARNLMQERDSPESFAHRSAEKQPDVQTILKSAIVFESYGLLDWAGLLLRGFSSEIGAAVDVDKAIDKLGIARAPSAALPEEAVSVQKPEHSLPRVPIHRRLFKRLSRWLGPKR